MRPLKLPIAFVLSYVMLAQYSVPSIRLPHLSSSVNVKSTFSVWPLVQFLYLTTNFVALHMLVSQAVPGGSEIRYLQGNGGETARPNYLIRPI